MMSDIIERRPNGTFAKGCSGNPGGKTHLIDEVRDLARMETVGSIQTLAKIRDDDNAPAQARVAASVALLDRGWGKPAQTVIADITQTFAFEIPAALEEAEWIELNATTLPTQ
jgi:hypothetical protein